jgi:hypothetical protein
VPSRSSTRTVSQPRSTGSASAGTSTSCQRGAPLAGAPRPLPYPAWFAPRAAPA